MSDMSWEPEWTGQECRGREEEMTWGGWHQGGNDVGEQRRGGRE